MTKLSVGGALLIAALPLVCQTAPNHRVQELLRFSLNESPEQVAALLGRPQRIDDSLAGYQSIVAV